jgi:prepilin-type N-terminal cleavage/methylation domain-containing protein
MKKRSGFTLIELTVTLVVLGILASLSVNAYISMVERGRWVEARATLLQSYAGYHRAVSDEKPLLVADVGTAAFWTKLGMSDPNTMANRKFNYTTPAFPQVTATRCDGPCPAVTGNSWTMTLDTGTVASAGTTPSFQ